MLNSTPHAIDKFSYSKLCSDTTENMDISAFSKFQTDDMSKKLYWFWFIFFSIKMKNFFLT